MGLPDAGLGRTARPGSVMVAPGGAFFISALRLISWLFAPGGISGLVLTFRSLPWNMACQSQNSACWLALSAARSSAASRRPAPIFLQSCTQPRLAMTIRAMSTG
jgi:hypothetical protein